MSVIEQISFQLASKNRQRCGGSDVSGKLVPDRGGHDDGSVVNIKKYPPPPVIFVDISAIYADFCRKFYTTVEQ